ncbi:hypothetical protein V2S66_08915 [Streptomyces sp. V4-01]|uniref:Lipoprotein n=1 Tax=Actinacidiphila polyblastidii TaxID=3110430 RepID=A0ABU7P8F6_9ACTN|nr:hypothetical protein [Streptomyces sp. V4-01]
MRWRSVFAAGVLGALLTPLAVACGQGTADDGTPRGRPATGATVASSPAGGPASSPEDGGTPRQGPGTRVVFFSSTAATTPGAHEVLRDRSALARFAGRYAARDTKAAAGIRAAGQATDFSRSALVGWTDATGCSAATSAALQVLGERLALHVVQPEAPPECFASFRVTVVFEVPSERLPARPVFG